MRLLTTTSIATTTANDETTEMQPIPPAKTRRGGSDRQLRVLRLNGRTILLIIAEAGLVYGAIIFAVYLRVGFEGAAF